MKIPSRKLNDIRNDIVRTRANIKAIYNDSLFTDGDRAILEPRYRAHLKKLEEEEKIFRTEVKDPKTVTA